MSSLSELAKKIAKCKKLEKKDTGRNSYNPVFYAADLLGGIVVGSFVGYYLDEWLDTMPIFLVIFAILGSIAGMVNMYRKLK